MAGRQAGHGYAKHHDYRTYAQCIVTARALRVLRLARSVEKSFSSGVDAVKGVHVRGSAPGGVDPRPDRKRKGRAVKPDGDQAGRAPWQGPGPGGYACEPSPRRDTGGHQQSGFHCLPAPGPGPRTCPSTRTSRCGCPARCDGRGKRHVWATGSCQSGLPGGPPPAGEHALARAGGHSVSSPSHWPPDRRADLRRSRTAALGATIRGLSPSCAGSARQRGGGV